LCFAVRSMLSGRIKLSFNWPSGAERFFHSNINLAFSLQNQDILRQNESHSCI
jgi:hypothetical protein